MGKSPTKNKLQEHKEDDEIKELFKWENIKTCLLKISTHYSTQNQNEKKSDNYNL
jgi:hypothetical protein